MSENALGQPETRSGNNTLRQHTLREHTLRQHTLRQHTLREHTLRKRALDRKDNFPELYLKILIKLQSALALYKTIQASHHHPCTSLTRADNDKENCHDNFRWFTPHRNHHSTQCKGQGTLSCPERVARAHVLLSERVA